jgi:hypothetical protein
MQTETIKEIIGVKADPRPNPTPPTVLTLIGRDVFGRPLDIRITQNAAKQLMGVLSRHPLIGGSG